MHIPKLILITLTLTIFQNIKTYNIHQYKLLTYNEITKKIQKLKNSNLKNDIFKIKNIYNQYPGLPIPFCYQEKTKKCKNYIFEITNFEKGENHIKNLPTILLIGGMEGNSIISANILFHFLLILKKNYFENKNIWEILQNFRILIIPFVNVNGFYRLEKNEMINNNFINPNYDFPFNLKKDQKCFKSSTSLILDAIFKNNLIINVLKFSNGDSKIIYPWVFSKTKNFKTGDNIAYEEIAKLLQTIAGEVKDLDIENYKISKNKKNGRRGNFLDWAYGASWENLKINKNCFYDEKKNYGDEKDIFYNDESNRAFVYNIQTGINKIPSEISLGNEISVFKEKSKYSVLGHISRNIKLIFGFIDLLKPNLDILKIFYNYEKDFLELEIVIKGCIKITELSLEDFSYKKKFIKRDNQKNYIYYKIQILNKEKKYYSELSLNLKCDHHWKNSSKIPKSHFVHMRTDPNYKRKNGKYEINSTYNNNFKILNIEIENLKLSDFIKNQNIITLLYTDYYKSYIKNNEITFFLKNNRIYTIFKNPLNFNFLLTIKKFGTKGCFKKIADGEKYFLKIKNGISEKKISRDIFFDILGRDFKIEFDNKIFFSEIILPEENKENSLILPTNGLTCGNKKKNEDYIYFDIFEENGNINITLLTKKKKIII